MLLIVLEVNFSLLFSNKVYFRMCFVTCKTQSPFFSCRSLLLGVSVPNDSLLYILLYWAECGNQPKAEKSPSNT